MGLDQYLYKRTYIAAHYEHRNVQAEINITIDGKKIDINPKKLHQVDEQVAYWRKANQIHNWFVQNCQGGVDDCREAAVSVGQLRELLEICRKIKQQSVLIPSKVTNGFTYKDGESVPILEDGQQIINNQLAAELLPTTSGFFFGSTDYDQYYMEDITCTIEMLEEALCGITEEDWSISFVYSSSW